MQVFGEIIISVVQKYRFLDIWDGGKQKNIQPVILIMIFFAIKQFEIF